MLDLNKYNISYRKTFRKIDNFQAQKYIYKNWYFILFLVYIKRI